MRITIRRFEREDIPKKIEWINNPENNQFLHYDIPLEIEKTQKWFDDNIARTDRYDAVIVADGVPCGTIGLLNIDKKNCKAEYYIAMGETNLKGKGISTRASKLILDYGFYELGLNRIYLYTETENIPAQKLFEKVGFQKEGCIRQDIVSHTKFVDRYVYGICRCEYVRVND
jgi:RimJ/RimL family protein N-acetyltransferase